MDTTLGQQTKVYSGRYGGASYILAHIQLRIKNDAQVPKSSKSMEIKAAEAYPQL
jgi:hypothetical protein